MRRPLALLLALGALSACAEARLKPGAYKSGLVVEAQAPSVDAGRRKAVESLFELYLSSPARSGEAARLEERILSRAAVFVPRLKVVSPPAAAPVSLHALVSTEKLSRELDGLGLVRPAGVAGKPRVLLSLAESGLGAGTDVGTASDSLRRVLMERGYDVVDFSDHANPEVRKTAGESEAFAEARKLRAGVVVTGSARSASMGDPRLAEYKPFSARVALKAASVPGGEIIAEFSSEATAVDSAAAGAASRALADAGGIAAVKLREALAGHFRERTEMSVLFLGLGDLERAKTLLADLRARPEIVAAALDSMIGEDVKVRVFVENGSADELAAALLRMPSYAFNVRSVEADYHYLELEAASHAF
ncbi:MAG: hypothetical protein HY077_15940 [Elusimicrobia bacterium]|nr:hypothetical protein [Elusimicrobiota bacterium]